MAACGRRRADKARILVLLWLRRQQGFPKAQEGARPSRRRPEQHKGQRSCRQRGGEKCVHTRTRTHTHRRGVRGKGCSLWHVSSIPGDAGTQGSGLEEGGRGGGGVAVSWGRERGQRAMKRCPREARSGSRGAAGCAQGRGHVQGPRSHLRLLSTKAEPPPGAPPATCSRLPRALRAQVASWPPGASGPQLTQLPLLGSTALHNQPPPHTHCPAGVGAKRKGRRHTGRRAARTGPRRGGHEAPPGSET